MIRTPHTTDDWFHATALLHDYVEWLRAAAGVEPLDEQPALRAELADLARIYDGRSARMFLAFDGTLPIGMIAVRHHPGHGTGDAAIQVGDAEGVDNISNNDDRAGTAELKRMYVRPVARGRGLADALVDHVIDDARRAGRSSVWLETLQGVMDPAIAVYERNGFRRSADVEQTIGVDGIVVFERRLEPAALAR